MRQLAIIERLQQERATLNRELQIDLPKQIEKAREHGDLRENAEYHAAKERQGMLHARIGHLDSRIAELSMFTPASIPKDRVGYGSRISVEDTKSGERIAYHLVFPEEADPPKGMISLSSPIGRAFLNRRPGDEVIVTTPSGRRTFEILDLTTIHDDRGASDDG
jgi:transcription elongation factor GreA